MTLGAAPELLTLGYLRNQRLVESADDVESISVDWDVQAAAVKTRRGIEHFEAKTARRVVTTGCGQGTVFGNLMDEADTWRLPAASDASARMSQTALYGLLDAVRRQESTYKSAGSVHGCALFRQQEMLTFVEDVGRHNAIDTIAGWMWLHDVAGARQGVLHDRAVDERDGHEVGADGRADHRLAQRRHADGLRTRGAPRPGPVRPGNEPPLHLLLRLRALRRRAGATRVGAPAA